LIFLKSNEEFQHEKCKNKMAVLSFLIGVCHKFLSVGISTGILFGKAVVSI
jgi:hypothetical protein